MPTKQEKKRVYDAFVSGRDWRLVAAHNSVSEATARRVIKSGRWENKQRGGARDVCTKITPSIRTALEEYVNVHCSITLKQMVLWLAFEHEVHVSEQTISRHLLGMLYTLKQTRIEPSTCNSEVNKEKRRVFAEQLIMHQNDRNYILYYDETNYNLYCKRNYGRSKKGDRAVVVLPPSQGPNLQLQCAVSVDDGLLCYEMVTGSIRMENNAAFVERIYEAVKSSAVYRENYADKKIVIVFDNAGAHHQTEERVSTHDDLVFFKTRAVLTNVQPY